MFHASSKARCDVSSVWNSLKSSCYSSNCIRLGYDTVQTGRMVKAYRRSKLPAPSGGNQAYASKTWTTTYQIVRCHNREYRDVNLRPRANLTSDLGQCVRFQAHFNKPQWERHNAFRVFPHYQINGMIFGEKNY